MLLEKLGQGDLLTSSEKEIANFVLSHKQAVLNLTAIELADKTYTSKATITRLCKKLGVKNYHEFKRRLENELNEVYRISALINEEPVNKESDYFDILNIIPSIYDKTISETKLHLDKNKMDRVIEKVIKASKISLYGSGISYMIAEQAAFKFMTLGIESTAYSGLNEHYVKASKNLENQVAFVISFTGSNLEMKSIAKYLRKNGVFVVGIGSKKGDLYKYCHIYIETHTLKEILSMEIITAYVAIMYILDVLFVSLLVKDYDSNLEASIKTIEDSKRR